MFQNCLNCPDFEHCEKKYDDYADFCAGPLKNENEDKEDK